MSTKAAMFGAIAWAVAFLGSAVALKGNLFGDVIKGVLLAGWIVLISLASRAAAKRRRSVPTQRGHTRVGDVDK